MALGALSTPVRDELIERDGLYFRGQEFVFHPTSYTAYPTARDLTLGFGDEDVLLRGRDGNVLRETPKERKRILRHLMERCPAAGEAFRQADNRIRCNEDFFPASCRVSLDEARASTLLIVLDLLGTEGLSVEIGDREVVCTLAGVWEDYELRALAFERWMHTFGCCPLFTSIGVTIDLAAVTGADELLVSYFGYLSRQLCNSGRRVTWRLGKNSVVRQLEALERDGRVTIVEP